jgi:hypothetical protein
MPDADPARRVRHVPVAARLLRGYGPLAAFAAFLLVVSVWVPSKVPEKVVGTGSIGPTGGSSGTRPGGTTGVTGEAGSEDTTPGGAAAPGGAVGAVAEGSGQVASVGEGGAGAQPCTDREEQVPGDPYSPPCISFSGGNGGTTTKGVTGEEILVAFRLLNEKGFQQTLAELAGASLIDSPEDVRRTVEALAEYFNQRFQFYGRKIKMAYYAGQGSNTQELIGRARERAEADATKVALEIKAFADLSGTSEPYAGALAAKSVVAFGTPYLSSEWHTKRRPFAWSLATDCTVVSQTVAEYSLRRLVGGTAKFAGGNLRGKPRKITALAPENSWYQECVNSGREVLRKAGTDYDVAPEKYTLDLGTMSNQANNIIPKLKNAGVTTIICGCDPVMPVWLSGAAAREDYYPEFINIGVALDDTDFVGQLWDQEFTKHSFGISPLTNESQRPPQESIAYEAYKTVRSDEPAYVVDLVYYQMYMLAIGIQLAGPTLTPDTFEQGMFSYPPKLGPFGEWGFGPGDYTPQEDVREIYWDPIGTSSYNGRPGRWVDPNPGKRYRQGEIPSGDPNIPVQ